MEDRRQLQEDDSLLGFLERAEAVRRDGNGDGEGEGGYL